MEAPVKPQPKALLKSALLQLQSLRVKVSNLETEKSEPIAIVGFGCRFPGAGNPNEFWKLLVEGKSAISEVPEGRWDIVHGELESDKLVRWGGFIDQIDKFDAEFFGINSKEAINMDPQQRLLLEVGYESLEYAGIPVDQLAGRKVGVFVGVSTNDYAKVNFTGLDNLNPYNGTGNAFSIVANRLSYFFDFRGPSVAIDTACSSSLVAVHEACKSLKMRESNVCLAGGVNLMLSPDLSIVFNQAQMLSKDGKCKTFDEGANGYVRGEGCGIIVLKRLSDALKDGNTIHAVIKGSAVNQDGRSNGLTAPNALSQQAVMQEALERAGLKKEDVTYIEAHGTGTPLGDPIEVDSIRTIFMKGRNEQDTCWMGSVKTNIGHLESAAGVAGLIKTILALKNKTIPPHLHFKRLNPHISLANIPLKIAVEITPWEITRAKRIAGINSFGFGGTNAHILIEEGIEAVSENIAGKSHHIVALSAKSEKALEAKVRQLESYLAENTVDDLADICYSFNNGKCHYNYRTALVIESREQALQKLRNADGVSTNEREIFRRKSKELNQSPIAFLFTGQGAQYVNMGKELYDTQPYFREIMDKCNLVLQEYLNVSLLEILFDNPDQTLINETVYTQPALFSIEYALAMLWKSWGVEPSYVLGHSVGEYVAACLAGVFSLEDGLKLIAARGKLMQQLEEKGEMIAVFAEYKEIEAEVKPYLNDVSIAAINMPGQLVLSGRVVALHEITQALKKAGIKSSKLIVSHAFHSPLMIPVLKDFEGVAKTIHYQKPQIPLISNITGEPMEEIATAGYWVEHITATVNFVKSIEYLNKKGVERYLEIGPKPTLMAMGKAIAGEENNIWLCSLKPNKSEWEQLLESLAALYVEGLSINWGAFEKSGAGKNVIVPSYPFERVRYWPEKKQRKAKTKEVLSQNSTDKRHPILGIRQRTAAHLKETYIWETQLGGENLSFLNDHKAWGTTVMPYSVYICLALASAEEAFGSQDYKLSDLQLHSVFFIPEHEQRNMQVVVNVEDGNIIFRAFGADPENSEWILYASAKIHSQKQQHKGHDILMNKA